MYVVKIERTLSMPMVSLIHETLVAYFRTSDHGYWEIDTLKKSDNFHLHFVRGNWGAAWLGLGGSRSAKNLTVRRGKYVYDSMPMLLKCVIRPSPTRLRLSLFFELHARISGLAFPNPKNSIRREWTPLIDKELGDLRRYLAECFDLAEFPDVDEQHGPPRLNEPA